MLKATWFDTANQLEARWYLNWLAKPKNGKSVKFNTFNASHKNKRFQQKNMHLQV